MCIDPVGEEEGRQAHGADDEIVLIEYGRLRTSLQSEPSLDECAAEVAEDRSERQRRKDADVPVEIPESPIIAVAPAESGYPIRISPKAMPENAPPKKPLQDFPSPNILFPRQLLPKSILVPPPKTTAAELGSMAGRNSQNPVSMMTITSKASIWDKNILPHSLRVLATAERVYGKHPFQ
mgnify:CR=1 FL=1